ncbi:MAG: hypothetical protein GIW95_07790 [Candidatus Eremiobacteraeota bacterium]|nr:hypothetical protein [Candidatus Eremiobacteraeota bacterium]
MTLEGLRETKAAANRPKDRLVMPEIEAMIEAEAMRKKLDGDEAEGGP